MEIKKAKEKKKDKVYDIYRETELTYSSYLFYW
mgnify:CR=1 FL=1